MPISTDTTRMSIEFIYEYQTPDGTVLQYQMKYQHTLFGPTITVAQAPYEPIELPADMFSEVHSFLVQQGATRPIPVIGKTQSSVGAPGTSLPLPSIGKKMSVGGAQQIGATNLMQEAATDQAAKFQISEEEAEALNKQRLEAKAKAAKAQKPFHSAHKPGGHKKAE